MLEFLKRVKRVSHVNRVSSITKPAKCIGLLLAVVFLLPRTVTIHASDITPREVIDLANADRRDDGLGDLSENDKLSEAAAAKAEDMVTDDYFSHTAPDGTTPWKWIERAGYDYNYAGENLAMDFVSAEKMNRAWLASPTHRANILNGKYKDIGVAVRTGTVSGHKTTVVVQIFGSGDNSPASAKKESSAKDKKAIVAETRFPALPTEVVKNKTRKTGKLVPVITSPQEGAKLPGENVEVFGRAESGSTVNLFDDGKFIAAAVSGKDGWFRANISGLGEGGHSLGFEGGGDVHFSIDTSKPNVQYQLLSGAAPGEMALEVRSDKPDCVFSVGSRKTLSRSGRYVQTFRGKDWLSLAIKVEDSVGNKAFGDVNLSNYYSGSPNNLDMMGKFAEALNPRKFFVAESGEVALASNLGLAPHQFLASRTALR